MAESDRPRYVIQAEGGPAGATYRIFSTREDMRAMFRWLADATEHLPPDLKDLPEDLWIQDAIFAGRFNDRVHLAFRIVDDLSPYQRRASRWPIALFWIFIVV